MKKTRQKFKHKLQLLFLLISYAAFSQQPYLVKDINQFMNNNTIGFITQFGGMTYFASNSLDKGVELWKSDGTEEGTVIVKDIYDGSSGSNPAGFISVGNTLYFVANDGTTGSELWKSDGTEAGTMLVKDISIGFGSSQINRLINFNGTLYFSANDGINGAELWKSDGTEEGTVMVMDISNGSLASGPNFLTVSRGILYFSANDGINGSELWTSDGTESGTVMVKDIFPGTNTSSIANSSNLQMLTDVNGVLYFTANNGVNGTELWKSDGTEFGTIIVKDILSGTNSSFPQMLTNVNGLLYFSANNGLNGSELWKSDGTELGTVMVKDIYIGTNSSSIQNLTFFNGMLYFSAVSGGYGSELWKSDGSNAGTVMVKDIWTGPNGGSPRNLIGINGVLYFVVLNGINGTELWKSDGTDAGTFMVKDIYVGSLSSNPSSLTNINGKLYFSATDGVNGLELWNSDGTEMGTGMVKDICKGTLSSNPGSFTDVNGTLFFAANDGVNGTELWKSDGTNAGTIMIKDIIAGNGSSYPSNFKYVNGFIYFSCSDGVHGTELWKTDGTAAGTMMVKDIYPGSNSSGASISAVFNGLLYFFANDGVNGRELWKSDGTAQGTVMVKDIYSGTASSNGAGLVNVNGTLFFAASDGINGIELWKTDGTAEGTKLFTDIFEGANSSNPQYLTDVNGTLFFVANDGVNGAELWKCYGSPLTTVMVKDIYNGSDFYSSPSNLTNFNGTLYFTINDVTNGSAMWKSDGTAIGTVRVGFYSGNNGPVSQLVNVNGELYFIGSIFNISQPNVSQRALFKSDGTAEDPVMITLLPLQPNYLTYVNGVLYFSASGDFGAELYAFIPPLVTPRPTADAQTLIYESTVANLKATGSNLKWYATTSGSTALSSDTVLSAGTYYVTQTINGLESKRLAVKVTLVNQPVAGIISQILVPLCKGSRQRLMLKGAVGYIQWQLSYDGNDFTDIPGATIVNYITEPLHEDKTYYRVAVTTSEDIEPIYSNILTVTTSDSIQNEIYLTNIGGDADTGNTTVCKGINSTLLVVAGYGSENVTWYRSSNIETSTAWFVISGATDVNYTATNLSVSTWYMAKINDGTCNTFTNIFQVYVDKTPVAGKISAITDDFLGNEILTSYVNMGHDITFKTTSYVASDFQWQVSRDNLKTWNDVGDNSPEFTIPDVDGVANSKIYVRVKVTNGMCSKIVTSSPKLIIIIPEVIMTSISGGNTVAVGGGGKLILKSGYYGKVQWQYSTDGETFTNVGKGTTLTLFNSGSFTSYSSGLAVSYVVSNVTATTYFRVRLTSGVSSETYSNVESLKLGDTPVAGRIEGLDKVCYGTGTTLTLKDSEGAVQWERSTNNGTNWYAVSGKTEKTVATGYLYSSTLFRAKVTVGSSILYTGNFLITVDPVIARSITSPTTAGTISATALCTTFEMDKVLNVGLGYAGTVSWEYSPTGIAGIAGNWIPIEGASGPRYTINYALPGLNYYRAKFSTGSCSYVLYSNTRSIYYKSCSTESTAKISNDVVESESLNVKAYPNPFNDSFKLSVNTKSQENIGLTVYDIAGRLLEQRKIKFNEFENIEIGNWYPSGVYIGIFVQGTEQKTLRIIKN